MKSTYILLLLMIQGVLPGYGQAVDAEEWIEKEISFLLWEDIREEVWVRSGDEWVPVRNLSSYVRSEPLQYRGSPELIFYRKTVAAGGGAGGEEEVVYESVGKVVVSATLKKPLVILVPSAGNVFQLRGMAFEDHPADFPMGTYKVFNMTRRELMIGLDEDLFRLPSGGARIVDPNQGKNTVLEFKIVYRDESGDLVFAQKTVFRYRIRRREIIFIKEHPEYPDRFQTHMVMEYLPMPPPPAE